MRALPSPAVPIAKPAAAQMNSTLGLTTVSASAAAACPGRRELAQALHPARRVRRALAGQPAVDAEHDQRRADDDAQPRRPTRWLCRGHRAGSRPRGRSTVNAARPISQPARKARPVGLGSRRVQHQHRRNDRQRRSATTSASGMSSVSTGSTILDSVARLGTPASIAAGFPIGALARRIDVECLGVADGWRR